MTPQTPIPPPRPWWIWDRSGRFMFGLIWVVATVISLLPLFMGDHQSNTICSLLVFSPLIGLGIAWLFRLIYKPLVIYLEGRMLEEHDSTVKVIGLGYLLFRLILIPVVMIVTFFYSRDVANQETGMAITASIFCGIPVAIGVTWVLQFVYSFRIRP